MSCSMVSGGKLFLALTPDPIWSLTPLNSLAARVYPSRVAVMLMWITWPCARLQWSRALPQSLSPIRDVIIGEDAAAQHHYSELRHYLAGNIRMFTITRCPDSTPTTPIKGSTKKLVFFRNDSWTDWPLPPIDTFRNKNFGQIEEYKCEFYGKKNGHQNFT